MARNSAQIIAQLKQAAALFEAGRGREAKQMASEVLKKEPRNVQALRIFALSAANSMHWPDAMKAAEKALEVKGRREQREHEDLVVLETVGGPRMDRARARHGAQRVAGVHWLRHIEASQPAI